jgi:hypothetical protein
MTGALAAIIAAGIVLPHLLHLHRVPPVPAVAVWLSSLALRAFACLLAATFLIFFLPGSGLFVTLSHWCAQVAVPGSGSSLALEGHAIAQVALLAPAALLGASLAWISVATVRDLRAARHVIAAHAVGLGPRGSVIVGGADVQFAVAGLVHPRIMVSAGALTALDDAELAAALNHEAGHIARRHRFVMLLAVGLRALGRPVPGGRRAVRELVFHLERDADRWALRRQDDRRALASVICKAAAAPPGATGLGGADVPERIGQVLGTCGGATPRARQACIALAVGMVLLSVSIGASVPAAALSGAAADPHRGHHVHHCAHGG